MAPYMGQQVKNHSSKALWLSPIHMSNNLIDFLKISGACPLCPSLPLSLWTSKKTQWVFVVVVVCCVVLFATQARAPGFDPLNPCKGGRRGPLPKAVLSSTHVPCLSVSHRNTYTHFKDKVPIISYGLFVGIFIPCLYPPRCEKDLSSSFRVHPTQPHREVVSD